MYNDEEIESILHDLPLSILSIIDKHVQDGSIELFVNKRRVLCQLLDGGFYDALLEILTTSIEDTRPLLTTVILEKVISLNNYEEDDHSQQQGPNIPISSIPVDDSEQPKKNLKPFWNNDYKRLSQYLGLPIQTSLVDDVQTTNLKPMSSAHDTPVSQVTRDGDNEQYNRFCNSIKTRMHDKKEKLAKKYIRARKFQLDVDKEQLQLQIYFGLYRWFYNEAKRVDTEFKTFNYNEIHGHVTGKRIMYNNNPCPNLVLTNKRDSDDNIISKECQRPIQNINDTLCEKCNYKNTPKPNTCNYKIIIKQENQDKDGWMDLFKNCEKKCADEYCLSHMNKLGSCVAEKKNGELCLESCKDIENGYCSKHDPNRRKCGEPWEYCKPPWFDSVSLNHKFKAMSIVECAIQEYCDRVKSTLANKKKGNIKKFKMKFKAKKDPIYSFKFSASAYSKKDNTLFTTSLKLSPIHKFLKRQDLVYSKAKFKGSQISYDTRTGKVYVICNYDPHEQPNDAFNVDKLNKYNNRNNKSEAHETFPIIDRNENQVVGDNENNEPPRILAIDPGQRMFITGYSPNLDTCLEIGENKHRYLRQVFGKISKIQSQMDLLNNYINDKDKLIPKPDFLLHRKPFRNRDSNVKIYKQLAKKKQKLYQHIKNTMLDCINKSVHYIEKRFDVVILGDLSTKSCVENSPLRKWCKNTLLAMSTYKLRCKLIEKLDRAGKIFILQNEAKTSQTCSCCGFLYKPSGKVYNCKSNQGCVRKDRDVNGTKNICMRAIIGS